MAINPFKTHKFYIFLFLLNRYSNANGRNVVSSLTPSIIGLSSAGKLSSLKRRDISSSCTTSQCALNTMRGSLQTGFHIYTILMSLFHYIQCSYVGLISCNLSNLLIIILISHIMLRVQGLCYSSFVFPKAKHI